MLLERQFGNINTQPSSPKNSNDQNSTIRHAKNWATFDDGTNLAQMEVNLQNRDKYNHDFLTKTRDPAFPTGTGEKIWRS